MLTMLNRMCWNSRGWRLPTHTSGDGGYPSKTGFGHEEWNFQVEDAVDGYLVGYLYYTPSVEAMRSSGGQFDIYFWSMHPDTHAKLLVGRYANASLLTDYDFHTVDQVFTKRDIYERRAAELSAAVPKMSFDDALQQVALTCPQK